MSRRTIISCTAPLLLCVAGLLLGAGRSDVADAVMRGDTAALRTLLAQRADVNSSQVDGATALHWAVYRDDLETADLTARPARLASSARARNCPYMVVRGLLRWPWLVSTVTPR